MVYIIVLNWKGAADTLACLDSLIYLTGVEFRVVICDNASPDLSYQIIRDHLTSSSYYRSFPLCELTRDAAEQYVIDRNAPNSLYLIQTGANLGYAGGNNVGIRFALRQEDMRYVWLLNNDTEVASDALYHLCKRCELNPEIGVCGSRLVYFDDREHLQGLGGLYNPWFCTTKHYAAYAPIDQQFDDAEVAAKIDYVIGASMLISREALERIGLLCEDYFLYYEELDYCLRAKGVFSLGVASNSLVFHKEGASTTGELSDFSDFLSIRNRLLITWKFNRLFLPVVYVSLLLVMFIRLRRFRFAQAFRVLRLMFGGWYAA